MNNGHIVGADETEKESDIDNSNNINSQSHAYELGDCCKNLAISDNGAVYDRVNGDINESVIEGSSGQSMLPDKSKKQKILKDSSNSDKFIDINADNSSVQKPIEKSVKTVYLDENNESCLEGHETGLINKENCVKYEGSSIMDETSDLVGSNTDIGEQDTIVELSDFHSKSDTKDLIRTVETDKLQASNIEQILSEKKDLKMLAEVSVKNSQVSKQIDDSDSSHFPSSDVATPNIYDRKPDSSVEQVYFNKDYSRFHLFKPPKIDLMSIFKQTIGHKDVKKPHTYQTAKAELQLFHTDNTERLDDKVEPLLMQNQCSSETAEHEVLMSAVNEIQVMFDRARIAPNTVSDVNVDHTSSFLAAKENKDSLLENVPKEDYKEIQKCEEFQSVPAVLEGSSRNELTTPDNELDIADSVNVNFSFTKENVLNDKSNDGAKNENEGPAKLKPRKQNRRGYAGKFAIAHMLEQTSAKINEENEIKTSGNSEIFNANETIAKEKLNDSLASNGVSNDEVSSNFITKSFSELEETDNKDSYQDLVLESLAVEILMKDDIDVFTQKPVKAKDERKVSFSSDEIVTEDSDSDSSSSEEELSSQAEENLVDSFQASINLSKQKENKHSSQVRRPSLELISSSKKSGIELPRRQRRKEFKIKQENELSDGEKEILEEARCINHVREDETFQQHHPGYPLYPPPSYPPPWQQYPTSHYNQWYPPNYMHFQHHPMQYQQYPYYPFPGPNWSYSMPYSNNVSSLDQSASAGNENMKQAFELQSDYIRSMCQKPDDMRKQQSKMKVKK